jgi:hypothetical protein
MTGFRGRPSKKHIIWTRETRDSVTKKRFDDERFEKWANHYNFDFETSKRVDHDRAEGPRMQYRCVFAWGQMEGKRFEFGDEEWDLGSQKTPRTFIEVDGEGYARIKDWGNEDVYNVRTMKYRGPNLLVRTSGGEEIRLEGKKLKTEPEKR